MDSAARFWRFRALPVALSDRFFGCRQHQLDPVELIDLAGTGVIVHRRDVCPGIGLPQGLDDALADDMVRKTGKGLNTHDVGCAARQQLHHLAGKEPALAVLVAEGQEGLRQLGDLIDGDRRLETAAAFQGVDGRFAQGVNHSDRCRGDERGGLFGAEELRLVLRADHAVAEEIHHIRHDGFGTLFLQQVHKVIVGKGHVLDEDLSDDADTGLLEGLVDGECVKGFDDALADLLEAVFALRIRQGVNADILPLAVQRIGRAGLELVGPHAVQAAHEQVAVDDGVDGVHDHSRRELEARILFHAVGVQRDDRDVLQVRLIQRTADEGDVVAGPAAPAGLGHDDGQTVRVVAAGQNRLHDLTHHGDGRVNR